MSDERAKRVETDITPEELRKRATDQYPWHPVETVLDAADTIERLLARIAELEGRSITCCFCNLKCDSLSCLKSHSAVCPEHPAVIENETMQSDDYAELEQQVAALRADAERLRRENTELFRLACSDCQCD
jgi:uncharacterized small protein (DUF1192 family)